jgi:GMP synthase-like glutamine amidotransferase
MSCAQVIRLPEGAHLLASSSTAEVEIWGVRDNVLAIQGHPELTCPVVLDKILPAVQKYAVSSHNP